MVPLAKSGERARAPWVAIPAAAGLLFLAGCANHYLIHPKRDGSLVSWSQQVERAGLEARLEWVRPDAEGPFPAVLVHPEAGHTAREMRGILRSLAEEGFLAVAADYRRRRSGLFPWKSEEDILFVLGLVRARPDVDPERIGLMGYSQGGVYSLLIAGHDPSVAAVVAYYPVTDFNLWLTAPRKGPRRLAFLFVRRYMRRASGASSKEEFVDKMRRASPSNYVEKIRAPVLLIHGDRDTSAEIEESRRFERQLREAGGRVELLEIPGAGHVFNFMRRDRAEIAWVEALEWLERHVTSTIRMEGRP